MSHGLGGDGWPSATTVIKTKDEVISSLKEQLAEREAEILALHDALGDFKWNKDEGAFIARIEDALNTPPSTSYLEQWEKDNFEVVAWRDTGSYILDSYTRHKTNYVNSYDIVQTPLYARKEK